MGLYKRENLENGAEICVWEISEDEDELRRLCAPIPSDELEDLQITSSPVRRKEKLAVRPFRSHHRPSRGKRRHRHREPRPGFLRSGAQGPFRGREGRPLGPQHQPAAGHLLVRQGSHLQAHVPPRQIEVERFTPRDEGELEATFIHKDGEEETFELNYEVFDGHVMVWLVG